MSCIESSGKLLYYNKVDSKFWNELNWFLSKVQICLSCCNRVKITSTIVSDKSRNEYKSSRIESKWVELIQKSSTTLFKL